MVIKVTTNGRELDALVDSGASRSIIQKKHVVGLKMVHSGIKRITGLGCKKVDVFGEVELGLDLCGIALEFNGLVVGDEDINYDVILGSDFLKFNRFSVNLSHRKISITRNDNSIIQLLYNAGNEVAKIFMQKVPVYCSHTIKTDSREPTRIPVRFNIIKIPNEHNSGGDNLIYYEGSNSKVETLSGIMSECADQCVFADTTKKKKINNGELLGYVCSMVTVDDEEEEQAEEWTKDRIDSEVKLCNNLTGEEKERVKKMLLDTKRALSKGDTDIGMADVEPLKIELTQETPIWLKARSFSQPINDEVERQCSELLSNDILEYSTSSWSSPIVPVRKVDGSLRLCIDYRKINKITKKENYPMPNLMRCIYKPNRVKFFTKLDLLRGYYQVPGTRL